MNEASRKWLEEQKAGRAMNEASRKWLEEQKAGRAMRVFDDSAVRARVARLEEARAWKAPKVEVRASKPCRHVGARIGSFVKWALILSLWLIGFVGFLALCANAPPVSSTLVIVFLLGMACASR